VVSLADSRKIDEGGATFRSHIDGSTQRLTPELAMEIQEALGSDIAVAFDHPVYPSSEREVVRDATERTHRWAERSINAHRRGAADAGRADRPCLGAGRQAQSQDRDVSRRSAAARRGLRLPRLPDVLARLPGAPVPGEGAPGVPPHHAPQPDVHARLHGEDAR